MSKISNIEKKITQFKKGLENPVLTPEQKEQTKGAIETLEKELTAEKEKALTSGGEKKETTKKESKAKKSGGKRKSHKVKPSAGGEKKSKKTHKRKEKHPKKHKAEKKEHKKSASKKPHNKKVAHKKSHKAAPKKSEHKAPSKTKSKYEEKRAEKKKATPAKKTVKHAHTPAKKHKYVRKMKSPVHVTPEKHSSSQSVISHVHRISREVSELAPEIEKLEKDARVEAKAELTKHLSKFSAGGGVPSGRPSFLDRLFSSSRNKNKGGSVSEKTTEEYSRGGGAGVGGINLHPHLKITEKGVRPLHGYSVKKVAKIHKDKDFSDKKEHIKLDDGFTMPKGKQTTKAAKKVQYDDGGGVETAAPKAKKKGGNPNFKPSYGIFTDKGKAEAQAKAKNGIVEVLKAKTVPAHSKKKRDKVNGGMKVVEYAERHYPVRYMVKSK